MLCSQSGSNIYSMLRSRHMHLLHEMISVFDDTERLSRLCCHFWRSFLGKAARPLSLASPAVSVSARRLARARFHELHLTQALC